MRNSNSTLKTRAVQALRDKRCRSGAIVLAKDLREVINDAVNDAGRQANSVTLLHVKQCVEMELESYMTRRVLTSGRVSCELEGDDLKIHIELVPVMTPAVYKLNFTLSP